MVADVHARALAELAGEVEVRGVFSRDPARRAAFAARHGLPAAASLEAMLADPGVEAILLLTPPDARPGDRRGRRPRRKARPRREAARAQRRRRGRARGDLRATPASPSASSSSTGCAPAPAPSPPSPRSGELGALAAVQVALPWWRPQAYYDAPGRGTYARDGGGVLITQAIHTLDLMLAVAGPVAEVAAIAGTTRLHRMEAEDFVGAGLRFAGGALGALVATTAAFPGGAGVARPRLRGGQRPPRRRRAAVTRRDGAASEVTGAASGTGGGADPMAFPHDWHRDVIADFAAAVRAGRPPAVPGRAALEVHRLIDALARSAREGRAVAV